MARPRPERPWPHLQRMKHPCDCKLEWCDAGRFQHYFGSTRIRVPVHDRKLSDIWLGYLGYTAEEKDWAWKQMTKRVKPKAFYVSAIHFYDCDVDFNENNKRMSAVLRSKTRHVDSMNGKTVKALRYSEMPYPSRPESGQNLGDGLKQSIYHWANRAGRVQVTEEAQLCAPCSPSGSGSRLRITSPVQATTVREPPEPQHISAMDVVATPQKPSKAPKKASPLEQRREQEGWSNSELWRSQLDPAQVDGVGNFVCGFARVVTLQQQVEQHARHCKGCLTWELRRMTQHGLAGRCVARCSLHTDCTYLPSDGELVWESSPYDEGTNKYMVNELYCGAIGYSQALHEASATLLDCMMLKAPCNSDVYGFVHTKVAPVVQQMKEEEEQRVAADSMRDRGFVAGGFDTAHDAVRNAPNSVGAMCDLATGELVTVNTLSEGTSASREPKILATQLDRVDELGIDLAVVAVDGCKDTAKQISSHPRVNAAAPADRSKTTDTALDTWHGDKTGVKNCKKFLHNATPELIKFLSVMVPKLAAEVDVVLTHDLMNESVSIILAQMDAWFARCNSHFERAARSADGLEGQWGDGVADATKLREFAKVLGATGASDSVTIDLSFSADDGDVETGTTVGTSDVAELASVTREQVMLDEVNAFVRAKNAKRKKQLLEFQCLGAIDPSDQMLGKEELAIIVSSMSNISKVDAMGKKKAELQSIATDLLPSASVVKGGLTLEAALNQSIPFIRAAFESRKKTRGTKRGHDESEAKLLNYLAELEKAKDPANPRECKSHPPFVSLNEIKPQLLSPRQVKATLDYFEVPLGEQPADTLRQMLSSDPVGECVAAVREASKLAEASRRRYFRHHSHSVRLVNETWGQASRSFKAWCITNSMLNFGNHMSNDHSNCKAHCWYSRCSDEDYIPREDFWTVCTGIGHPRNVPKLATLLMKAWTLGKYMHSLFYATALHCRTSACESFFHAVDVWLPMWAGFSQKGYELGVNCCFLTHNEQRRTKRLTTGSIVKEKSHPDGILRTSQRRSRTLAWRLTCQERVHAKFSAHIEPWLRTQRAKLEAKDKRRIEFVRKFEAAKAIAMRQSDRGRAGATLNRCPLIIPQLKMAYTQAEGLIHLPPDWPVQSKRPTPPFPLSSSALLPLPDDLVTELGSELSAMLDESESVPSQNETTQADQAPRETAEATAARTSAPIRPTQGPQQKWRK